MIKNKSNLSRREFITLSALGILSGFNCIKRRSSTKPNLIFIFADQFRRHAMGFMNEDPVITPNFDRFAKESLVFTNAVSSVAICSPFRAMLMTGRFPKSTGIIGNCKTGIDFELKENEICFGDVLNNQGYRTAYIGKWHLECPSHNKMNRPPDWAHPGDAWTPPGPRRHGFQFWYAYNSSDMHFNPHFWSQSILPEYVNEWSVKHETDVVIDFIKRNKSKQPFAVFLSWGPPHPPHYAPEKYMKVYQGKNLPLRPNASERKERLNYYAQVTACDDEFGRLVNFLESPDLKENTIVVFTADHGEMMGSHGRMQKDVWYEEAIGIPFLIRWPEKIHHRRTDMLFAVYDFMPTLLGLMELPIPNTVEGKDYSETLLGHTNEEPTSAFIGHYALPVREHYLSVGTRPNKSVSFALSVENAGIDPSQWGYRGIRTKRYTYVVDRTPEGIDGFSFNDELETPYQGTTRIRTTRLLYDNMEDPYQQRPIIASRAEENKVMKELEIELRMWLNKMNDPFPLED